MVTRSLALLRRYITHVSFFFRRSLARREMALSQFFFTYILSLFADATLLALRAVEFAPIADVDRTSMSKFLWKGAVHL